MNIREAINTPGEDEDIVCATDRYITALNMAEKDALEMMDILIAMRSGKPCNYGYKRKEIDN